MNLKTKSNINGKGDLHIQIKRKINMYIHKNDKDIWRFMLNIAEILLNV